MNRFHTSTFTASVFSLLCEDFLLFYIFIEHYRKRKNAQCSQRDPISCGVWEVIGCCIKRGPHDSQHIFTWLHGLHEPCNICRTWEPFYALAAFNNDLNGSIYGSCWLNKMTKKSSQLFLNLYIYINADTCERYRIEQIICKSSKLHCNFNIQNISKTVFYNTGQLLELRFTKVSI